MQRMADGCYYGCAFKDGDARLTFNANGSKAVRFV